VESAIYDREHLKPGAEFAGPAIVEQADSTTVVPPDAGVRVDGYGNLVLDVRGMARL
jgi:N-methylhydantoinase A